MKKIVSLVIYIFLSLFIAILSSCRCGDIEEYEIVGFEGITVVQDSDGQSVFEVVDTITKPFRLHIDLIEEFVSHDFSPFFINAAYGYSCEEVLLNPLDTGTYSLSIDKAMLFDGEIVPAGTNILGYGNLLLLENIIAFQEEDLEDFKFENGTTTFTFSASDVEGGFFQISETLEVDF